MGVIEQQIARATQRASGFDLVALVRDARDKVPRELATEAQMRDRLSFLEQSLADTELARGVFERIIFGNELQDVNYLPRGEIAARSIARIVVNDLSGKQRGWATGFMIAPRVLLTNHHVFPSLAAAKNSVAQFEAERDIDGVPKEISAFRLLPDELFYAFETLDFSVVAVESVSYNTRKPLGNYGTLPLVGRTGKVADGEWLTIVQHPNGELKQLCVRENKLIKRTDDALWYSTDTLGGSSGSPVFNNDWYVVALHHSGIPEKRSGVIQTVDGRDYDPMIDPDGATIKWIANEGIRVSRIVSQLRTALPTHPLMESLLEAAPEQARVTPHHAPMKLNVSNTTI
jgi:endonuclease G, mitochondrial